LWTLTPSALCVTIPMALLFGVLFGLGRLSADREFVAMQACGISLFRVFRPIAFLAVLCCAATAYETIVALPAANQTYREIILSVIASWADNDIKPRVFFGNFPNRVIYARDIETTGGWREVFLADDTQPDQTTVYFAERGRLVIDREKQKVELVLDRATRHTTYPGRPDDYDVSSYETLTIDMDANTVFQKSQGPLKGDNEMTIAELRATAAANATRGAPNYSQRYTIQQKFSLPAACIVLALIGLSLGVTNRKDGKLGSFALGFGVVFVYYILLYSSRGMALGGRLQPTLAPWLVNIVLFAAGLALVSWRAGAADQPIRVNIPAFWRRREHSPAAGAAPAARRTGSERVVVVVRVPHFNWPRPGLLDFYISRQYLSVFALAFVSLVGIFYISTFIDLADKLFRGAATTPMLLRFFYFQTPQYVYYIVPLSTLVASLVTIGLLTKNSELIVMRACGISLYRSSLPLLLFAVLSSLFLFELQEHVLADSNREAARLNGIIRGYPQQTFGILYRRWIVGASGDIYHYEFFDPSKDHFDRLSLFELDHGAWKLQALTYAKEVVRAGQAWEARQGWRREFSTALKRDAVRTVVNYTPFSARPMGLEPPAYFKTDEPEADRMTYAQLSRYVTQLKASGYHAVPYMVQLQRKVAFPFVTVIMTVLAVPFAASMGRSGAMFGIGVGIVLSIVYWTALSLFGALGAGGWISPMLGAWAPNILFGAAALYMLLTVRT
jgi:lipopolysaccharide export system permease protein